MLAEWLKKHYVIVWWSIFLLSLLPAISLWVRYLDNILGLNPLATLIKTTGQWSLIFLILSLSITPLRRGLIGLSRDLHSGFGKRLSDWNWIIRLRRMIGLYSFFYVVLHLMIILHFDVAWDWIVMLEEMVEKPYMFVGLLGFVLLVPVTITSTNGMMRRLGRNWRRLHRLVYFIAVLVLLHIWLQSKVGVYTPWPYTVAIAYLLGYRLIVHFGWFVKQPMDDGMEVPERGQKEKDWLQEAMSSETAQ